MTDSTDSSIARFERGMALLAKVGGSDPTRVLDSMADIAPDLGRLTIEFGYGDIYGRPGLTLPQRQIINVATLTAMGTAAPQLRFHIDGALNVGVTPTEIVEAIMHMCVYAGFPAALNGLAVAKAAFADRPEVGSPVAEKLTDTRRPGKPARDFEVGGSSSPLTAQRYERGLAVLRAIDGHVGEQVIASLADIAPDFGRYLIEFAFGDIYSRSGLDLKTRELATVAACAALGTAGPQLRVHLHGLLNVGGTRAEAVEAIIQMAGYAGFPAALNGIAAAREVFAARDADPDRYKD